MSVVAAPPGRLAKEIKRLRESALVRNAGWMMVGQGIGFVLQGVYFILLARLLSSTEYGVLAGAFAFTALVAQYAALGTGTVFLRYVSVDHKAFAIYWGNILLSVLGMSGLLVLVLPFLGRHLLNPSSAALVLISTLANCVCGQLIIEIARIFQAFERMRVTAMLNLLTQLMRTLAVVGMLFTIHHATAWQWAVVSLVVSAIAAVMAIVAVIVCYGWPQFKPRLFVDRGVEGLNYAFAASTSSVYNDIDKTMLSHYGMNYANGIYSMAYRIVEIATMPIFSLRDAALPRFFQQGRAGIVPAFELSTRLLKRAALLGAIAAVGMFVTSPLIPHIVGHGYAESAVVLRWLCLIPLFRSVHQMTGVALTGAGFQRYRTLGQVLVATLNFGTNLWLIPHYGWLGAAWSSLATDGALGIFNFAVLKTLVRRANA